MKTIEIIISPQGETRLETKGFLGAECQAASRAIEDALGLQTQSQRTADFYRTTATECQLRQGDRA